MTLGTGLGNDLLHSKVYKVKMGSINNKKEINTQVKRKLKP